MSLEARTVICALRAKPASDACLTCGTLLADGEACELHPDGPIDYLAGPTWRAGVAPVREVRAPRRGCAAVAALMTGFLFLFAVLTRDGPLFESAYGVLMLSLTGLCALVAFVTFVYSPNGPEVSPAPRSNWPRLRDTDGPIGVCAPETTPGTLLAYYLTSHPRRVLNALDGQTSAFDVELEDGRIVPVRAGRVRLFGEAAADPLTIDEMDDLSELLGPKGAFFPNDGGLFSVLRAGDRVRMHGSLVATESQEQGTYREAPLADLRAEGVLHLEVLEPAVPLEPSS